MKKSLPTTALLLLLFCASAFAQLPGKTLLVLPFENRSKVPGLDWIGESFPEVLGRRIPGFYVIGRDDRLNAFDRMGLPANLRPSRATIYEIAQAMDVDYLILGSYSYDGKSFSARAQVLDMSRMHLSAAVITSGSLPSLIEIQTLLAWDLLRLLSPNLTFSRNEFVAAAPPLRLDAFENYIRGIVATARQERIQRFREAVRLNPGYTQAIFQLGKAYYDARDYATAVSWLERIPKNDLLARQANFYLGICYYYQSEFGRAANAFEFVAARLPLTEVYNNLGVVAGRRGQKSAAEYFERAVQADPKDADYRFNLAIALLRAGDSSAAARQLREELALRPTDAEARALLDSLSHSGGSAAPLVSPNAKTASAPRLPLERIKRNYDEASFHQLAMEIQNLSEMKLAGKPPREHAAFHVERGRELLSQGFVGEAQKHFREAVTLDPGNAAGHVGLAETLASDGSLVEARVEARTALRYQALAEAYLVLARIDLRENSPEAARDDVERALLLEPTNVTAVALKQDIAARLAEKTRPLPPQ